MSAKCRTGRRFASSKHGSGMYFRQVQEKVSRKIKEAWGADDVAGRTTCATGIYTSYFKDSNLLFGAIQILNWRNKNSLSFYNCFWIFLGRKAETANGGSGGANTIPFRLSKKWMIYNSDIFLFFDAFFYCLWHCQYLRDIFFIWTVICKYLCAVFVLL